MPKIKPLFVVKYENSLKYGSKSRLYNLMKQTYKYTYRFLMKEFKFKYSEGDSFFVNAYSRMTFAQFDKICSLCPRHSPGELFLMIVPPYVNFKGFIEIQKIIKKNEKVLEYEEKQEDDIKKMLLDIINAETFELRQKAIEKADRKLNRLTFDV